LFSFVCSQDVVDLMHSACTSSIAVAGVIALEPDSQAFVVESSQTLFFQAALAGLQVHCHWVTWSLTADLTGVATEETFTEYYCAAK
jgi:hypothetical protein